MLGLIVWCIIIIVIAACIMPWWFLPAAIGFSILVEVLRNADFSKPRKVRYQDSMPHLEKVKREIEQQKKAEAKNGKDKIKTNNRGNRTKANISAGTYYQKNDNFDYDRYIAAKKEERAAYDDFIASLDMDN